jgi:hypothetical protein
MKSCGANKGLRRLASASLYACAACIVVGLLGCQNEVHPPQRPQGVPKESFWLGGPDGGVFVRLLKKSSDPPAVYRASIYEDTSGALLYEGQLSMVPPDKPVVDTRDAAIFSFWDGQSLHLIDGRELKVVPGKGSFRRARLTSTEPK